MWAGASEILGNPKVQAALAVRRAAIEHRTQISQEQVRVELAHIAFFDPPGLLDPETEAAGRSRRGHQLHRDHAQR
jgi:Terminase small subunit